MDVWNGDGLDLSMRVSGGLDGVGSWLRLSRGGVVWCRGQQYTRQVHECLYHP